MDNTLALLVGRVILAFGDLDQQTYHSIQMLQNMKEALGRPEPREIDGRWDYRLRQLRQLFVDLSNGDARLLSRYDTLQNKLKLHERQRGLLAHGIITPIGERIIVYDRKAMDKSADPNERITLSRRDLVALPDAIFDARQELFRFRNEVRKLCGLQ